MEISKIIILTLIPFISGIIGWFTNYIAIKSLFRPIKEVSFLGFKFQGLIVKEKKKIISKLSKVISEYIISNNDLIIDLKDKNKLNKVKDKLIPILKEKIENAIPIMIKPMAQGFIDDIFEKNSDKIIVDLITGLNNYVDENVDIEKIIYNKLNNYDISNIENIIFKIARDEFRHIEFLGGFIGFIIGLFQVLLFFII